MSAATGSALPHPAPRSHHRAWGQRTGVTACPHRARNRAAAVTLATTASAVICARVPSVYRSFGCQDRSWGSGEGRRQGCWVGGPKHFEGVSGQDPRGLLCFMWPLMPPHSALS